MYGKRFHLIANLNAIVAVAPAVRYGSCAVVRPQPGMLPWKVPSENSITHGADSGRTRAYHDCLAATVFGFLHCMVRNHISRRTTPSAKSAAIPARIATTAITSAQLCLEVRRGSRIDASMSARLRVLAFQAKSNRSPSTGTVPTIHSIPTLSIIRSRAGKGTPLRAATATIYIEMMPPILSPIPGINPIMPSSPIRQRVPGMGMAWSRRNANCRRRRVPECVRGAWCDMNGI